MRADPDSDSHDFFDGDGETAALMRAHRWASSPLGPPDSWPQTLRTVVALILDSNLPMFVAWGPELICLYNDSCIPLLGAKHPSAIGMPLREVWSEIWSEIDPLVCAALGGRGMLRENLPLQISRKTHPEQARFTFSLSPLRGEANSVSGLIGVGMETTPIVDDNVALRGEIERLAELFRQAPGFIAVMRGPNLVFEIVNAAYEQVVGYRDLIGRPVREAMPELEGQGFFELLDEVYQSGQPFVGRQMPMRLQKQRGGPIEEAFFDFVYQPIRDRGGKVTGIFLEGSDVTDQVWAEEYQQLLINELNHRVKNTLATVQSIVSQTLRHATSQAEARNAIEQRLMALSRTHDMLIRENWKGAEIRELVAQTLEPFQSAAHERFSVAGPELKLSSRMALDLSLALHELATNAVKYGALSNDAGRIEVVWSVDASTDPPHLRLRWEEEGGPPAHPPNRKGFGFRLIERSLARDLEGEVAIEFMPRGVVCTIEAPITA
ncbi:sensor histidine kinase [Microvirga sp. 2TAF3]|uniref:sensor histidine kinase n=1 Tax=Microvirga sp. 2TAF3 TaxID=3233014 RepID=UPI003F98A975